jgi:hypothetical protein
MLYRIRHCQGWKLRVVLDRMGGRLDKHKLKLVSMKQIGAMPERRRVQERTTWRIPSETRRSWNLAGKGTIGLGTEKNRCTSARRNVQYPCNRRKCND